MARGSRTRTRPTTTAAATVTPKSSFAYWTGTYNQPEIPSRTCRTRRTCRPPARRQRRRPPPGFRSPGQVVTSATSRRRTWCSRTRIPTWRTSSGRTRRGAATQCRLSRPVFKGQETNDYVGLGSTAPRTTRSARRPGGQEGQSTTARPTRQSTTCFRTSPAATSTSRPSSGTSTCRPARTSGQFRWEPCRQRQLLSGRGRLGNLTDLNGITMKGAFSVVLRRQPDVHARLPRLRTDQRRPDARVHRRHAGGRRADHVRLHLGRPREEERRWVDPDRMLEQRHGTGAGRLPATRRTSRPTTTRSHCSSSGSLTTGSPRATRCS